MRSKWMILGLVAPVAAGAVLELASAETADPSADVLALVSGALLMVLVTIESAALSPGRRWVATLLTAVKVGAVTGAAFVIGLYLPWALSIGDREPTEFAPVRDWYLGADLLLMAWGALYGAILGVPCGIVVVIVRARMNRQSEKGGMPHEPSCTGSRVGPETCRVGGRVARSCRPGDCRWPGCPRAHRRSLRAYSACGTTMTAAITLTPLT